MSNQKRNLNDRINTIVNAIDINGKEQSKVEILHEFPGWSWKCDVKGKYISCSDEVFDCLGISPAEFVNKSLFTFRLTKESSSELKRFLTESKSGGNLVVRFEHVNGKLMVVNLNISEQVNQNQEVEGWSGFNQIIEEEEEVPSDSALTVQQEPAVPVVAQAPVASQQLPVVPQIPVVSLPATEPVQFVRPQIENEEVFALSDYFMVLLRRRWVVLITFFFTMLIVASILSQMPSKYTAKAIVRVSNPRSGSAEYIDYNTELGQRLLGTYVELANGDTVKQQLKTYVDRVPTIKASQVANSELFEITAEDIDPGLAQFAANKIAELIISDGAQRISSEAPVNVYIAESASLPKTPSSASPWLIIGLAVFVGLLGGSGLAFIFENLDTRLYSDKQIEALTDLPVVGNIPDDGQAEGPNALVFSKKIHAESFQRMRTNIFSPNGKMPYKSILFTSPVPRDGKSSVIANFAINLANANRSVCILDANLRYPSIHSFFKLGNDTGLSDVLQNKAHLNQVINKTAYPYINVITSGHLVTNPVDFLDSNIMRKVIAELTQKFDVVLVDSPASTSVTDPAVLSSMVDGVLLVVRHGWVRKEALTRAIKHLTNVHANIIGVVSNKTDQGVRARIFRIASRK